MNAALPRQRAARPVAPVRRTAIWLLVGVVGWAYVVALGAQMFATTPRTAGFDLELLLEAGRRIAAGQSPYDPALIAGAAVQAESLFYSYPPPVAQVLRLLAGIPSGVVLVGWAIGATAALVVVGVAIARRLGVASPWRIGVPLVAVAPFVFPYTVALLFGNLDAWFPALYGLLLIGALRPAGGGAAVAGAALAVAALAKLHPASLGLWFLARGAAERRVVVVAAVAAAAIVGASLVVGGLDPWRDYLAVVRAGMNADLLDPRNAGPAAQLGLALGLDGSAVRQNQAVISLTAIAVTAWAARARRDPVESLGWAAAASLATLPVTWFHYPAAMIPFAVAAVARASLGDGAVRRRTYALTAATALVAMAAIVITPLLWVAVGLVLGAVRSSSPMARRNAESVSPAPG